MVVTRHTKSANSACTSIAPWRNRRQNGKPANPKIYALDIGPTMEFRPKGTSGKPASRDTGVTGIREDSP